MHPEREAVMKKILQKIPIWLCALLFIGGPVAIVIWGSTTSIADQRFFAVDWEILPLHVLFTGLFLLPAIILGVWMLLKRHFDALRTWQQILLTILFVLSLGVGFIGMVGMAFSMPWYSRTDDPAHYMQLDTYVNASPTYVLSFFPQEPGEDAVYRYRADYNLQSLEVYASWELSPEEIEVEIARLEDLWQEEGRILTTDVRGRFTCLTACEEPRDPERYMSLFAYDPQTGECRWYDRYRGNANLLPESW